MGNVVLQKGIFKKIKPWLFPFQGILGLHPPKQRVVWEVLGHIKTQVFQKGHCALIPHAKMDKISPGDVKNTNRTFRR